MVSNFKLLLDISFLKYSVYHVITCNSIHNIPYSLLNYLLTSVYMSTSCHTTSTSFFIICSIAIAYCMGQIMNSVCLCQSLCLCISIRTLTIAISSSIFNQKCHRGNNLQKYKEGVSWRSMSHRPFPYFAPKPLFVLKIHANHKYAYFCL